MVGNASVGAAGVGAGLRKEEPAMRQAIAIAVLALVVPAAASAKQGPPPLAATWAPGVEISYTETVADGLGNVVSRVHRDGIPAGASFGTASVAGVETIAGGAPARRLAGCCSSDGSGTVRFGVTQRSWVRVVAWRGHPVAELGR